MQYDVNNGLLQVVIEGEEINAVVGEAAQIDVGEAINYIQSGTAEIEQAVQEGITQFNGNATEKTNEFDLNAQNKTSDFNSNATQKTLDFNSNASDKTSEFNLNAQDKTSDFNANAAEKTNDFNSNAQDKTGDFNDNAVNKTNYFNDNATDKTGDFNLNAQNKTSDFNDNYTEKKGLIDAQVIIAEGAATTATNQAGLAKQWAIGDPSEPVGNSSKYWAEYAESIAQTIGDPANKDLSNLSTTGNNRFVNLQQQIDAIVASSDVFDIVGTYAELQAYDISTVPVNDIIKVLVDETHSGAATYYRCTESGGVKSWSYIGSEGAYYTKGETNTLLSAKQDTLVSGTNIKTINSNSILGSGNLDINGLPTQTGQSGKFLTTDGTDASWADVDALPSQTGQSGKYLTTDGSSASWATLSVNPDNKSITTNSSDELQTVGVINSRDTSTAIKTWTGTKAQYDAIVTKDANTLYNITDDTDVSLTILEALYPVGSVYITTANTCPLSTLISGSTWELVSSGRVLQGADSGHTAGTTIEAGLPNIEGVAPIQNTVETQSGAFYIANPVRAETTYDIATNRNVLGFDASLSNPIYGNSSTVQPPAYIVNIYRRTA